MQKTHLDDLIFEASSIFQQPWWLNAVAPGMWSAAEVQKDGKLLARLPYIYKRKNALRLCTMPKLTQSLGPWLTPSRAKYSKSLKQQKDLMTSLIQQIPECDYFCQNFHYSITNWLPFYWHGFSQTTAYTYVIQDLGDLDKVWSGFQENIRTDIRKASKNLSIRTDLGLENFLEINNLTFARQRKKIPYSHELVYRVDKACEQHQSRKIFFAEDSHGVIHAAIYLIWDKESAYYLMGGADPSLRNSGAMSLLIWEAIKFSAKVSKKFDFEGSMIESIERFFRGFGASQVPYFRVTRASPRMKLLLTGRDILNDLKRKNK